MLRCCRRDVEVPARVAAAVRRFAHLTSGKYVFCGFLFFVNFTKKRVPELVYIKHKKKKLHTIQRTPISTFFQTSSSSPAMLFWPWSYGP